MAFQGQKVNLVFGLEGLTGNQNQRQLRPTQLIQAFNIDLSDRTVRREQGGVRYTPVPVAGGAAVLAGFDWIPTPAVQRQICYFADGTIRRDDGAGTFTTTLASGLATTVNPQFVAGGSELPGNGRKLFMFNGVDAPLELVGDGITMVLVPGPVDWAGTNQPSFGTIHVNRLWAGGVANAPHRMYYSDPDDHDKFAGVSAGTIEVFQGDGPGQILMSAASFNGLLLLSKTPQGVYVLDTRPTAITDWQLGKLTADYGSVSSTSLVQINGNYIFLTPEFNVISLAASDLFGNVSLQSLSQELQLDEITKGLINRSLLAKSQGIFYPARRQIWFTAALRQSTVLNRRVIIDFHIPDVPRVWVSDRDTNTALWIFMDTDGVNRPMIGDDAGNVFLLDEEGTFAKDLITPEASFQTPHMDFAFLDPTLASKRKNGRALELLIEGSNSLTFFVDVFWDGELYETITFNPFSSSARQLAPANPGGQDFILDTSTLAQSATGVQKERLQGGGIRLSLRIRTSLEDTSFSLAGAVVFFQVGDERVPRPLAA